MSSRFLAWVGVASVAFVMAGCQQASRTPEKTGFLSDYSKLESVDSRTDRFLTTPTRVRGYSAILIEPVEVRADDPDAAALAVHATDAFKDELRDGYYTLASGPAVGVATLRVAVTEIDRAGRRVAVEGELVDSVSGEQLMAVVSSRLGGATPERIMERWANRFRDRLDSIFPQAGPATAGGLPEQTGFLRTYANLQPRGPASLRYVEPNNRLAQIDKFVIMPVESYFHADSAPRVSEQNMISLRNYFAEALARELTRGGAYEVVSTPGFDVAEIHVAITDVQPSWPVFNALPRFKFTDAALGGVAMEGEIVDSLSGVQLAALVEAALGRNLRFDPTRMDDARGAMDALARRVRTVLDEVNERAAGG